MLVDTLIEDDRWVAIDLDDLAARAAAAVLVRLGLSPDGFELSLLGCDDARIAVLNADFREKPQPTNVLSWPSEERGVPGGRPKLPKPQELGDIALSFDTCQREANEAQTPLKDHVTHLIVHGTLHLLGYDHVRDDDAALMEGLEITILNDLGVLSPYEKFVGKD